MGSGFGFHSKSDESHERFSTRGVTGSHLDFNRLVLAVVLGRDSRQRRGDQSGGHAVTWVRDAGSLD